MHEVINILLVAVEYNWSNQNSLITLTRRRFLFVVDRGINGLTYFSR